jgi:outer membrane receptor protein involved in Fe transport
MRVGMVAACLSFCLIALCSADDARASIRKQTNIPAEGLGPALNTLARDRNFQIVYVTEEIAHVRTDGAVGEFTTEEALKRLLAGTGLAFRYLDDKTITVGSAAPLPERRTRSPKTLSVAPAEADRTQEGKETSRGFRVAQVDPRKSTDSVPVSGAPSQTQDNSQTSITEILVTAQKREERLQDVPVPVTFLSGSALADTNQLRLQDFYETVPGLVVSPNAQSIQQISIRGIAPGIGNPTVGLTVDDVPYGASATEEGGLTVPDIDPSDLDHIEVLRGPQGTLYGASSMGGLIKFVTVDPSTESVFGHLQAGTNSVQNGAELGYSVRGSVNLPVTSEFALRASGFARQDPGYIDNPVLGIDGINEAHVYGGHLSGLWKPADDFSLKFSALYQDYKGNGLGDVDINPGYGPPLGDLQQNYVQRVGPFSRQVQAYSANLHWKPGNLDLVSISGYNISSFHDSFDLTPFFGPSTQGLFGVTGTPDLEAVGTRKLTQELRLSSSISQLDWLVGVFYTHERAHYDQNIYAEDPVSGPILGLDEWTALQETYTEYAAFGNLTWHFTDRFDVQLGARESHNRQTLLESGDGGLFGMLTAVEDSSDSSFTYLFTPRYKISDDWMVYSRIASGYRAGGPNNPAPGVPLAFKPDTTKNYEVGTKGSMLDNKLLFDASVYYIDWRNIQISEAVDVTGFVGNGGRAKSQGVELSLEAHPLTGLKLSGWVAYNDAVLTQDLPAAAVLAGFYGASGDRLPLASRFSASVSAQQGFPLGAQTSGYIGATASYVGDRVGDFVAQGTPRQDLPAYTKTDLRAGAKHGDWNVDAYVNNLTNRRGLLNGGVFPGFAYIYIQPRTVGLSVKKSF